MAIAVEPILSLLESGGLTGLAARGLAGGVIGLGVADIIKHFTSHPADKTTRAGAHLKYAIVDLHNNQVIMLLSTKRVYRILTTKKRGKSRSRKVEFIVSPEASTLTRVK